MNFTRVKICVNVPPEATDKVREALGKAGAGVIGDYTFCSFIMRGQGYSLPNDKANPYKGTAGKLEISNEDRVEVVCDRDKAHEAVKAMKAVHPHEEVAFDITPLIDRDML